MLDSNGEELIFIVSVRSTLPVWRWDTVEVQYNNNLLSTKHQQSQVLFALTRHCAGKQSHSDFEFRRVGATCSPYKWPKVQSRVVSVGKSFFSVESMPREYCANRGILVTDENASFSVVVQFVLVVLQTSGEPLHLVGYTGYRLCTIVHCNAIY